MLINNGDTHSYPVLFLKIPADGQNTSLRTKNEIQTKFHISNICDNEYEAYITDEPGNDDFFYLWNKVIMS